MAAHGEAARAVYDFLNATEAFETAQRAAGDPE